jgi:hypothetical protein
MIKRTYSERKSQQAIFISYKRENLTGWDMSISGANEREVPFQTIPNDPRIDRIEYRPKFAVLCEIGLAPFSGEMEICLQPKDRLLEFESFEGFLREISTQAFTIESLTRYVYDLLIAVLGAGAINYVTIKATTQVHGPVEATIYGTTDS